MAFCRDGNDMCVDLCRDGTAVGQICRDGTDMCAGGGGGNPAVIAPAPKTNTGDEGAAMPGLGSFSQFTGGTGALTLTATGLPAGVSLVDNGDGTWNLSGTFPANSGSPYTYSVTATDTLGEQATVTGNQIVSNAVAGTPNQIVSSTVTGVADLRTGATNDAVAIVEFGTGQQLRNGLGLGGTGGIPGTSIGATDFAFGNHGTDTTVTRNGATGGDEEHVAGLGPVNGFYTKFSNPADIAHVVIDFVQGSIVGDTTVAMTAADFANGLGFDPIVAGLGTGSYTFGTQYDPNTATDPLRLLLRSDGSETSNIGGVIRTAEFNWTVTYDNGDQITGTLTMTTQAGTTSGGGGGGPTGPMN